MELGRGKTSIYSNLSALPSSNPPTLPQGSCLKNEITGNMESKGYLVELHSQQRGPLGKATI